MKKLYMALLLVSALLFSQSALASVGTQEDGNSEGAVADINYSTNLDHTVSGSVGTVAVSNSPVFSGDVTFRTNLLSNGRYGSNSTVLFSSSTTLQIAGIPYAVIFKAIGNNPTAEFTTLPAGTPGQEVVVRIYSAGPSGTWILRPDTAAATPVRSTGFTSLTFNAAGQSASLLYINDTLGWIVKDVGASASGANPTLVAPTLN